MGFVRCFEKYMRATGASNPAVLSAARSETGDHGLGTNQVQVWRTEMNAMIKLEHDP
jgi:hypothetical protein